jgi:hypothetical protein
VAPGGHSRGDATSYRGRCATPSVSLPGRRWPPRSRRSSVAKGLAARSLAGDSEPRVQSQFALLVEDERSGLAESWILNAGSARGPQAVVRRLRGTADRGGSRLPAPRSAVRHGVPCGDAGTHFGRNCQRAVACQVVVERCVRSWPGTPSVGYPDLRQTADLRKWETAYVDSVVITLELTGAALPSATHRL